jgi:hypothetical protein
VRFTFAQGLCVSATIRKHLCRLKAARYVGMHSLLLLQKFCFLGHHCNCQLVLHVQKLRVFENGVLKRIFGPKRNKVTGG